MKNPELNIKCNKQSGSSIEKVFNHDKSSGADALAVVREYEEAKAKGEVKFYTLEEVREQLK